jgi:hypothetical protein
MTGLFGGILGLFNVIGGIIISILIGSVALNQKARIFRIAFGSVTVSFIAGGVSYLITKDTYDVSLIIMFVISFSFLLELLRSHIEDQ